MAFAHMGIPARRIKYMICQTGVYRSGWLEQQQRWRTKLAYGLHEYEDSHPKFF